MRLEDGETDPRLITGMLARCKAGDGDALGEQTPFEADSRQHFIMVASRLMRWNVARAWLARELKN